MKTWIYNQLHWIIVIAIGLGFFAGYDFSHSKEDLVALVFGGIGLIGSFVLAFIVEKKKRSENQ
ncbi:hypothetical protein Q73_13870 [Bacillus coahuilensis m2-6]|uniref:Uncharacterized protein n=1 Tax=Bacillus coahuilensis p1.1.43 TaxID=1150625 RepID=A0A147K4C0_9BACI|nr:hypothetical protein [Bacillus coahuilensis]KUP04179.1 hypothetical protein Q75_16475 [Bacillus coahuilensis p1.1.43]KUP05076.1 hypothetical protein Q73_13870 [Bacillus coahuilensis m2-6]